MRCWTAQTKNRVDGLILTRQRIRAGRLLPSQPKGASVPDPGDQAREAKAVTEQVVCFVLDWLGRKAEIHRPNQRPHSVYASARTDSTAIDPMQPFPCADGDTAEAPELNLP